MRASQVVLELALVGAIALRPGPERVIGDPGAHRLHPLAGREVRGDRRLQVERPARPVLGHRLSQALVFVAVPVTVLARVALRVRGVDRDRVTGRRGHVEPRGAAAQPACLPARALGAESALRLDPVRVRVEVLDLVQAHAEHRQQLRLVVLGAGLLHQRPDGTPEPVPLGRDAGGVERRWRWSCRSGCAPPRRPARGSSARS